MLGEIDILRAEHGILSDAQDWIWGKTPDEAMEVVQYIDGVHEMAVKLLAKLGEECDAGS